MKLVALLMFIFSCCYGFCQNISMTVSINNTITDSILSVSATVQSTYEISIVTATDNNMSVTLTYNAGDGAYEGSLLVSSLPKGVSLQLIVTAQDVLNNQQSDTVSFIYDPRPVVMVSLPLFLSNTNMPLPLKATSSGTSACTLNVTVYNNNEPIFNQNFISSVDTVISLPPGSTNESVTFTATDQLGQVYSVHRQVFYDNNPFFKQVYSGTGQIEDFNYNKVLASDGANYDKAGITDITTNVSTVIPGANGYLDGASYLTPYGAFYNHIGSGYVYDWNNDSLYSLGNNTPMVTQYMLPVIMPHGLQHRIVLHSIFI